MDGKSKCKILKEIRRQIAKENNISFVTEDCKFKGNCKGTCPKCESELIYLEQELEKRRHLGKVAAIAGIAIGGTALAGCTDKDVMGNMTYYGDDTSSETSQISEENETSESENTEISQDETTYVEITADEGVIAGRITIMPEYELENQGD